MSDESAPPPMPPEDRDERCEAVRLFWHLRYRLVKEAEELDEHFNIARNLACSKWTDDFIDRLTPNEILPKTMDLLHTNYDLLREHLSYQRYLLIKAFLPLVGGKLTVEYPFSFDDRDCYNGWVQRLKERAKEKAKTKSKAKAKKNKKAKTK